MNDQPDLSWERLLELEAAMRKVVAELRHVAKTNKTMPTGVRYAYEDCADRIESALSPPPLTANVYPDSFGDRAAEEMDAPQDP